MAVPVVVAVVGWEAVTRVAGNSYFPPPTRIFARLRELWLSGPPGRLWLTQDAVTNLGASLGRLLAGWLLACVIGVLIGFIIGRSPRIAAFLEPTLKLCRNTPPPLLLPVFLAIFAIGTQMQLATIAFGVVWPVLLNSAEGARSIDPGHIEVARVYRLTRRERLRFVMLPSAAPKVAAGMRLGLSIALILMVVSELVASTNGVGYQLILLGQQSFDIPAIWAGICVLGCLGWLLDTCLLRVERGLLAGHPDTEQLLASSTRQPLPLPLEENRNGRRH